MAGLVPWADVGHQHDVRRWPCPLASWAARMAIRPHSSPWAPALGDSATAGMLVRVISQCARRSISSSAPCTVETGCSGWMSAKPGSRAIFSLRRGLCFMVHEPSGYMPRSMAWFFWLSRT